MKVSELEGALLDYWVAKAAGKIAHYDETVVYGPSGLSSKARNGTLYCFNFEPSTDWRDGGPIIEREKLILEPVMIDGTWVSYSRTSNGLGATPLIAAMRCFVAGRYGESVPCHDPE